MYKSIVVFIIALCSFAYSENFEIKTHTRTNIDLNKGLCENVVDSTTFIIRDGRFSHITPTITSTYIYQSDVFKFDVNGSQLQTVIVKSEVGNYYYYMFDLSNYKVIAYSPSGGFISEFDIIR